jgi:hypothetical protein
MRSEGVGRIRDMSEKCDRERRLEAFRQRRLTARPDSTCGPEFPTYWCLEHKLNSLEGRNQPKDRAFQGKRQGGRWGPRSIEKSRITPDQASQ